ncbi:hypothetical protein I308_101193 [Cryptococcus tetragattii IND107]|uniref:Uncharacterized protein n=1 Tax=Cryptococcus tetragattii IND107 TaxID=1296105 RepID=A0ABR3C098_9TREE
MGSHNTCLCHDNPIALASNAALSGVQETLLKMRIEKNEAPRPRNFRVLVNRMIFTLERKGLSKSGYPVCEGSST